MHSGEEIEIGTDASPWGLGGWVSGQGAIMEHSAGPITDDDELLFGTKRGDCLGQQTWECLAILVAARIWSQHFRNRRIRLKIRGDNVGTLTLVLKMRPHTPQQAIVAREIALICATAPFPPETVHTPGIAHTAADHLSRLFDPGADNVVSHHALVGTTRNEVPNRRRKWYLPLV